MSAIIPAASKPAFKQHAHIMQRLPANIAQLVEASPSATEDGALLLGSHSSSVYVVDGKTGTLLRVLSPLGQQALDAGISPTTPALLLPAAQLEQTLCWLLFYNEADCPDKGNILGLDAGREDMNCVCR